LVDRGLALVQFVAFALAGGWARAATSIADCKAYSGISADEGDKSGLVFIPGRQLHHGV